jgi:hypothetical protein
MLKHWPLPDREFVATIILQIVQVAWTFFVLLCDERVMTEQERAHAWHISTRNLLAVYIGPLALLFHFWRSRAGFLFFLTPRGYRGPLFGFVALFASLIVTFVTATYLDGIFQLEP